MIRLNLKMMISGYFEKSGGYKCESEATDSDSPLISFEFNTPAIAQKMTDSS